MKQENKEHLETVIRHYTKGKSKLQLTKDLSTFIDIEANKDFIVCYYDVIVNKTPKYPYGSIAMRMYNFEAEKLEDKMCSYLTNELNYYKRP